MLLANKNINFLLYCENFHLFQFIIEFQFHGRRDGGSKEFCSGHCKPFVVGIANRLNVVYFDKIVWRGSEMYNDVAPDSFANLLHFARRRSGVSQKDAAFASGMDRSYLAALENGRRSPPGLAALHRLLDAIRAPQAERARIIYAAFCTRCDEELSGLLPAGKVEPLKELLYELVRTGGDEVEMLADIAKLPLDERRAITGFIRVSCAGRQSSGTMLVALDKKNLQEIPM